MNAKIKVMIGVVVLIIVIGVIYMRTAPTGIRYTDPHYGFSVDLPQDWAGYSIVTSTWQGLAIGVDAESPVTSGPMISIRNPAWTSIDPHQDIPVMIFTLGQWADLQNEKFHIGAAPIGPSELGRNPGYVFALPARYNYAYQTGYEEVDRIIQGHALRAFPPQ